MRVEKITSMMEIPPRPDNLSTSTVACKYSGVSQMLTSTKTSYLSHSRRKNKCIETSDLQGLQRKLPVQWLEQNGASVGLEDASKRTLKTFIPREVYSQYIKSTLKKAESTSPAKLTRLKDEAVEASVSGQNGVEAYLYSLLLKFGVEDILHKFAVVDKRMMFARW